MNLNRREFLHGSGALVVCFSLPGCSGEPIALYDGDMAVTNRLRISATGEIELLMGKVEFGQGIGTALAQLTAEELDVDVGRIRLQGVDTSISPNEFYTFSSISVQQSGPPTRKAAVAARRYLLERASEETGSPIDKLSVVDGRVFDNDEPTDHSYWNLIGNDQVVIESIDDKSLKPFKQRKVIGESVQRIDIPGKVFGDAAFIQDLRLPDMVHARVVRPPAERGSLVDFDGASIEAMAGVLKIVRNGDFLAIIAEREGQARNAANGLRGLVEWDLPSDMPDESDIYGWLRSASGDVEQVADKTSDQDLAIAQYFSGVYQRPYQAHASLSPSVAIAKFQDGKMTVWSHAQGMFPLRDAIGAALDIDVENIRCIHYEASGCYGHNGADDAACDAAAIAMQLPGRPVRLQWERADEFTWEPYGSAMHIELSAGVSDSGQIREWNYEIWSGTHSGRPRDAESAGNLAFALQRENPLSLPQARSVPQPNGGADRNGVPLYEFDNVDVKKHLLSDRPIRVSALRGLGAYANVFAIESFIDELAQAQGVDPFEYRLRHLQDARAIALLERLADISDWHDRPRSGNEGWGVGFARFKNISSYCGVVMRLGIDEKTNEIRLNKAYAVCDAGLIINPDGVSAQIEGGIVQSASWTLKEQVRFSRKEKLSLDWASYPILRFDEVPEISVELMERDDEASLGVGETAQGPTVAAIANAVFDATGKRLRRLPLSLST